jgi:hypothetical protein
MEYYFIFNDFIWNFHAQSLLEHGVNEPELIDIKEDPFDEPYLDEFILITFLVFDCEFVLQFMLERRSSIIF